MGPGTDLGEFVMANPDGSGQVGRSWYAVAGDQTDVTHYLQVGPQGIQVD